MDSEPRYLEAYAETNSALHAAVDFVVGRLEDIPFPDVFFDSVACISVLEHTESWRTCLEELIRVVRPGGLLLLTMDVRWGGHDGIEVEEVLSLHDRLAQEFADLLPVRMVPPANPLSTEFFFEHDPSRLPFTDPRRDSSLARQVAALLRGSPPPFEPLALAGFQMQKKH